jgi:hypothetical protein
MSEKQPETLKWADAIEAACMPQLAQFLRTQHADIERKDALLRQALGAFEYEMKPLCMCFAGCDECDPATAPRIDQISAAIRKELQ